MLKWRNDSFDDDEHAGHSNECALNALISIFSLSKRIDGAIHEIKREKHVSKERARAWVPLAIWDAKLMLCIRGNIRREISNHFPNFNFSPNWMYAGSAVYDQTITHHAHAAIRVQHSSSLPATEKNTFYSFHLLRKLSECHPPEMGNLFIHSCVNKISDGEERERGKSEAFVVHKAPMWCVSFIIRFVCEKRKNQFRVNQFHKPDSIEERE